MFAPCKISFFKTKKNILFSHIFIIDYTLKLLEVYSRQFNFIPITKCSPLPNEYKLISKYTPVQKCTVWNDFHVKIVTIYAVALTDPTRQNISENNVTLIIILDNKILFISKPTVIVYN